MQIQAALSAGPQAQVAAEAARATRVQVVAEKLWCPRDTRDDDDETDDKMQKG